ncbi:hypothetical protein M0Q28_06550 [Patescibacteria group bacterium]|jgi:hypothetical protein|nr:hypothetical protein [Patescibacteria group bacterium]
MNWKKMGLAALVAAALTIPALAAGLYTNGLPVAGSVPLTLPLTGDETIPMDTNLTSGLNPATEAVTTDQLAGFIGGNLDSWRNGLIGGDFGQNLWQRGTTSASITTALLYGPDRWWGLSGTGTAFTIIQETASQPTGFGGSARVQRTASETGVLPVCVGQVLSSANSYNYAGELVEFSFWAKSGANFSSALDNVTATVATGTGANGSAANFSTGAWTGYAAATATSVTISTTWTQYSVTATIPATAAQVGVKICYTPVGTAGADDWFEFTGAQLAANPGASARTSGTDTAYSMLDFEHRLTPVETTLQQAYYFRVTESAAITPVATCANSTTSLALCWLPFPQTMRIIPTMTYTAGFAANTTTAMTAVSACTALATASAVASTAVNTNSVLMGCTSSAAFGAAGTTSFLYSNNGSGVIQASAEL